MLKKPKFELGKPMELHDEGSSSGKATGDETGAKVERADGYEPPESRIGLKCRLLMVTIKDLICGKIKIK